MGYAKGIRWSDDLMKEKVFEVMKVLMINRMPSARETEMVLGNSSLSNRIAKTGGFYKLAKKLKLEIKDSCTKTGIINENRAEKLVKDKGWVVNNTSVKYAFDLLIDNNIKVDVKSSNPFFNAKEKSHIFGINKLNSSCDLFILIALNTESEIETVYIIPCSKITETTLKIKSDGKYDKYINRWDYFNIYHEFYLTL